MFASFFIDRPVLSAVISIVIVLAGFVALKATPIAQYPDIAPPTVQVTALYPGATAEVISNTVAAPIEQQVNGVDRMSYMSSTSSSTGNMTLTVTFEPGTDPDMAQVNVQNRVSQAQAKLPDIVAKQGVTVEKRSQAFMMVISVFSPDDRYDQTYLANYTNLYLLDPIKRLPGANLSSMFPVPDIAMRIWLNRTVWPSSASPPTTSAMPSKSRTRPTASARSARPPPPKGRSRASWSPPRAC